MVLHSFWGTEKHKCTQQNDSLRVRSLEAAQKKKLAESLLTGLTRAREEFNNLLYQQGKKRLVWAKCHLFEYSSKLGSMLAKVYCGPRKVTYIPHLIANQGTKLTSSGEMAEVFCDRGFTTLTNSQTMIA